MLENIREILLIVYLSLGILVALVVSIATFFIARTILKLLGSVRRTLGSLEEVASNFGGNASAPFTTWASAVQNIVKVVGFVTGFGRRRNKKD
jgi:hypothetical protein